ncbi:hypothetical protein Syun_012673 [Stephania yunnanensis]|uniref:Pectinesterase inhibitor domain-containing protein n=1 Tax=Stephania yunnanensis TaxID=152371 RepID=A0AAP0PFK5_9MAGN
MGGFKFKTRSSSLSLLLLLISLTTPVLFMHVCIGATIVEAKEVTLTLTPKTTEFIKNSCGVTMYPKLCYKSLSAYASSINKSPAQLANVALSVSLTCARSTSTFVLQLSKRGNLKPREAAAVRDCVENIGDSVSELQESLEEMRHLRGGGFEFNHKMTDIQTWVSAALTNEDTCMDGFEGDDEANGSSVKNMVRSNIKNVAQLTSNALSLINCLSKVPKAP